MKIKPTTYAQLLIASLQDKPNFKDLSRRLWYMLQKNKQYRDLSKILDELEKVYAEKEGFTVAHVESGKELNIEELEEIKRKLQNVIARSPRRPRQSDEKIASSQAPRNDGIVLKVKINPSITGIIAKIEGETIDLSIENKISRLRKQLSMM